MKIPNLGIKSARSEQGIIQVLGPVCGAQNYDTLVGFEAIHLTQQLNKTLVIFS